MDNLLSAVVPMSVLTDKRLGCNTKVALSIMAGHSANGVVTVSQVEVAEAMGITPQSLSEALRPAKEAGLIVRVKRCGVLTWRLAWPDSRKAVPDDDQAVPDSPRARTLSTPRTSSTKSLVVSLTDDEVAKVHAAYDAKLGAVMVTNQIAFALDYAREKRTYRDFYRFVMNWLIEPARKAELHALRVATEKARLAKATAPYRPAVDEPAHGGKFRDIRDIVAAEQARKVAS